MSKADLISLRSELERTRDNVHNDLQGVKYALYGYKDGGNIADNSNTLVVEEEGEAGGLEELLGQFNSGRIQYGLAGIKLEMGVKCVLIAWQGEGAPILRKSVCAHHLPDIISFLRPSSTFIARFEEELDLDTIIKSFS